MRGARGLLADPRHHAPVLTRSLAERPSTRSHQHARCDHCVTGMVSFFPAGEFGQTYERCDTCGHEGAMPIIGRPALKHTRQGAQRKKHEQGPRAKIYTRRRKAER